MLRRLLVVPSTAASTAAAAAAAAARPRVPLATSALLASQQRRRLSSSGAGGGAAADAQSAESAVREGRMRALLEEKLQPTHLVIQDISGGCGAMYNMEVESPLFEGKTLVAQHRMVNEVLAKEIAEMHGLSLKTRPSKT